MLFTCSYVYTWTECRYKRRIPPSFPCFPTLQYSGLGQGCPTSKQPGTAHCGGYGSSRLYAALYIGPCHGLHCWLPQHGGLYCAMPHCPPGAGACTRSWRGTPEHLSWCCHPSDKDSLAVDRWENVNPQQAAACQLDSPGLGKGA